MKRILIFAFLFAVGCQTMPYQPYAREVKKRPQAGGVVAMTVPYRPEDRAKADEVMMGNCGTNPIKILEEGEVVVGQKTNTNANSTTNYNNQTSYLTFSNGGMQTVNQNTPQTQTSATAETVNVKEWQITYDCVAKAEEPAKASAKSGKAKTKKTE